MRVAVGYVYPLVLPRTYYAAAQRFARTYRQFPPDYEHELHILANGRQPAQNEVALFNGLSSHIHAYDNSGWDIGAFQRFAETVNCDLMVCLGANCHFYRRGWLKAMVDAVCECGPGLFGCAAYMGDMIHVRTTTFWFPPELLQSYPAYIGTSRASRYEFEHGKTSFTHHVLNLEFPCVMATWEGNYAYPDWHDHAPDANQILVRDQHIHL
jgi:hypothetical protein